MQPRQSTKKHSCQRLILTADIGGTNADFALVAQSRTGFYFLVKHSIATSSISDFTDSIEEILSEFKKEHPAPEPEFCCISAAGPVRDGVCSMPNAPLVIDAAAVQGRIGIRTLLINDFSAISYSLPLLDINDSSQIAVLAGQGGQGGSFAVPSGNVRAVTGAGTGMGVGVLLETAGKCTALASEAGHISFASFDSETAQLREYTVAEYGEFIEAELLVSGRGIANIYKYFRDVKKPKTDHILREIENAPDKDKPAIISMYGENNDLCRNIMKLFIKCYAHFAANIAEMVIPRRGLYLAGGIVTKNEKFFIEDNWFMRYFALHSRPGIQQMLKSVPVYIIRDYSISLLGAANAVCAAF